MISYTNVSYSYPHQETDILKQINCSVEKGKVLLITGPSGCGKSTFMRASNGLIPHFYQGDLRGQVEVDGQDVTDRSIMDLAEQVGSLFQDPEQQFFTLDVESEIAFSHEQRGVEPEQIRSIIRQIAERLGIAHILDSSIFSISEGEKQKTALASTLSLNPGSVLLDEPTANLDHDSTLQLAEFVRELKAQGMAVIIVDHRLYWLDGIVDEVIIMREGAAVERGPFSLLSDPAVRAEYGLRQPDIRHLEAIIEKMPRAHDEEGAAISASGLTFAYRRKDPLFENANFTFPLSRVTAVMGSNGCGKTTLARILTGLNKLQAGTVCIGSEQVTSKQLLQRAGLVFQNADHQLFMNSVQREMIEAGRKKYSKKERAEKATELLIHFNLHEFADRHPQSLSGGQKQRLVIACAMMKGPDILILDEPTSGLDGKNLEIISDTLQHISRQGMCVVVVTHDLELVAGGCDVILNLTPSSETGTHNPITQE